MDAFEKLQMPRLASIVEKNDMMLSIVYRKPESTDAVEGSENTPPATSRGPKGPITSMADVPFDVIYDYERLREPLVSH